MAVEFLAVSPETHLAVPAIPGPEAPPVVRYEALLRRVHALAICGQGDTPEICEAMDASWLAMSSDDRARMSRLSEDLRYLTDLLGLKKP